MKYQLCSTMRHSQSSNDFRPSRKFMNMVNKLRHTQHTLHSEDSQSDRIVLQNVINKADRLSHKAKERLLTFEDITEQGNNSLLNVSLDVQYKKLAKHVGRTLIRKTSISLQPPRSRGVSPIHELSTLKNKLHERLEKNSFKDKIKKLTMAKKPELQKLDYLIEKAINDLDSSNRPNLTLKKHFAKEKLSYNKKISKHFKHQNIQVQVISILLCLLGTIIIFFVM